MGDLDHLLHADAHPLQRAVVLLLVYSLLRPWVYAPLLPSVTFGVQIRHAGELSPLHLCELFQLRVAALVGLRLPLPCGPTLLAPNAQVPLWPSMRLLLLLLASGVRTLRLSREGS